MLGDLIAHELRLQTLHFFHDALVAVILERARSVVNALQQIVLGVFVRRQHVLHLVETDNQDTWSRRVFLPHVQDFLHGLRHGFVPD